MLELMKSHTNIALVNKVIGLVFLYMKYRGAYTGTLHQLHCSLERTLAHGWGRDTRRQVLVFVCLFFVCVSECAVSYNGSSPTSPVKNLATLHQITLYLLLPFTILLCLPFCYCLTFAYTPVHASSHTCIFVLCQGCKRVFFFS